jgi:hypothetical protein
VYYQTSQLLHTLQTAFLSIKERSVRLIIKNNGFVDVKSDHNDAIREITLLDAHNKNRPIQLENIINIAIIPAPKPQERDAIGALVVDRAPTWAPGIC